MSFASDLDVYEEVMYNEAIKKSDYIEEKELTQCITLPKCNGENLVVGKEIIVNANDHLLDEVDCQATEAAVYFEENFENYDKVEYRESNTPISLTESSVIEKWDCEDIDTSLSQESKFNSNDKENEETIATFVTAAGQQLALYAVEDSDEIYAVALYDESGEPPTNFQFLMKADVERLIGEGAVRTVKKPTRLKKQLLTTQSPVFFRKKVFEEIDEQADNKYNEIAIHDTLIDGEKYVVREEEEDCGIEYYNKITFQQNYNEFVKNKSTCNDIIYTAVDNKQSDDFTYLMMNNCPMNIDEQMDENQDTHESDDDKLVEHSTVQYILLEDDQSDSELTFDEIQMTLQNLRTSPTRTLSDTFANSEQFDKSQEDYSRLKRKIMHKSPQKIESSSNIVYRMAQCTVSPTQICLENESNNRQRLIEALTNSPPLEKTPRLKRSRKQQLTSMNRDDGEIIIQLSSMLNEEELIGKKRGRRRRLRLPQDRRVTHEHAFKKIKKKKQQVVEIINLDADEEEQQAKRNVVEITLDDSKDNSKYSSDKENEIIMVTDSDSDDEEDEEEQSNGLPQFSNMMQCEHCSRNFRQRRAFDTHLRVCQKSPQNALRLNEKKMKVNEEQARKQYTCKVCQKKFDVVVALARHVRVEHSQRKKHKWRSTSQNRIQDKFSLKSVQQRQAKEVEKEDKDEEEQSDDEIEKRKPTMLAMVKRKCKQRSSSWEAKKLNCASCGRWFPSSALLDAHSLQHDTKKSEQQLRKCHVCKKLIKSRLLFVQHLKMHSNIQSRSSEVLRRKLRTRPSARKIISLRKRGRPRKF